MSICHPVERLRSNVTTFFIHKITTLALTPSSFFLKSHIYERLPTKFNCRRGEFQPLHSYIVVGVAASVRSSAPPLSVSLFTILVKLISDFGRDNRLQIFRSELLIARLGRPLIAASICGVYLVQFHLIPGRIVDQILKFFP